MGVNYNSSFRDCKTALDVITKYPSYVGKDNYYMLWPNGSGNTGQLVWCDMTTDGGGWMLIARSHPSIVNYNGQNWGWTGGAIGSVKDFSQAYQAGWTSYWHGNATFSSFLIGNRNGINDNNWGPFIYKTTGINYTNLITSDTQQSYTRTTLKSNTQVYGTTAVPSMQAAIGFGQTGANNNLYYMRDCCGFAASYGAKALSITTTYCNQDNIVYQTYPGPWCGGSSTDGNGIFLSNPTTTANNCVYGGTNQYMLMVR
jgi:hypothetical protein